MTTHTINEKKGHIMENTLYNTVTVEQFKEYFFRDFSFLPLWVEGKVYFNGDIVFYNQNFYTSLADNNTALPTNTESWKVTQGNQYDYVTDADIERAMSQAMISINARFGSDDETKILIYLHLVAFYLVMDWKNAQAGTSSSYSGFVASKSVGDVSESYNFPQWVTNSPVYSMYLSNGFGMKYLSLIIPYLSCTVLFSRGRTTCG